MSSPKNELATTQAPVLRTRPGRVPRFLLLLTTALIFLVATPLLGGSYSGVIGGKLILAVMLLVAVAELHRTQFRIGLVVAIAAIITDWIAAIHHPSGLLPVSLAIRAGFFLHVAGVVLYSVLRQRTVTLDTIAGASCVYLFVGFLWASLFALLDHLQPGSIQFPAAWANAPPGAEMARYVYFSFVTLTTLGYGDIVPATVDASGLVVAEAVVGQLYLTVLVARLVGLHLSRRREAGN